MPLFSRRGGADTFDVNSPRIETGGATVDCHSTAVQQTTTVMMTIFSHWPIFMKLFEPRIILVWYVRGALLISLLVYYLIVLYEH